MISFFLTAKTVMSDHETNKVMEIQFIELMVKNIILSETDLANDHYTRLNLVVFIQMIPVFQILSL